MRSLLSALNAFEKSILISARDGVSWFTKVLAACTPASKPLGVPAPSCSCPACVWNFGVIVWHRHFAKRLCRISPMAIGLIPPSSFWNASSLAPKKEDWISHGTAPDNIMLVKFTSFCTRIPDGNSNRIRYFRCWGVRPSGPPAVPAGKENMAFEIRAASTEQKEL